MANAKRVDVCILIISIVLLVSCDKRPFAHVELHGRIVNWRTNQSLQADVQLWVGGASPGSNGTTFFGGTRTDGDGYFDIKSNAQWNGKDYKLLIIPDSSSHQPIHKTYSVGRNQNFDVGTIGM